MPYWDRYEPTQPIRARGGIRAQSGRGSFGSSWWAKRWMATLDDCGLGARLTRGRSYARNGQVLAVEVEKGQVRAKVQGSRPKPYDVSIRVAPLTESEWQRMIDALAGRTLFAARLLAGEMPQDIEEAFQSAGLSLLPTRMEDLQTDCSCPDWSNPCKHTAAVYCLLGEEFDRDPFLIFTLRGITRDELIAALAGLKAGEDSENEPAVAPAPPEPLAAEPQGFWHGATLPADPAGDVRRPPVSAALVRRLGGFPFWRGEISLLEAIEPDYRAASAAGMEVCLGEMTDSRES